MYVLLCEYNNKRTLHKSFNIFALVVVVVVASSP